MLIAHFPAGYLLGRFAQRNLERSAGNYVAACVFANMLPDLDMLYFHLFDGGRTHHHAYFTHWPTFWSMTGVFVFVVARQYVPKYSNVAAFFFISALVHMAMDSVAAPIDWLRPFGHAPIELFHVQATQSHWILSFMLHWTFAIEIAIWLAALYVYFCKPMPLSLERTSSNSRSP